MAKEDEISFSTIWRLSGVIASEKKNLYAKLRKRFMLEKDPKEVDDRSIFEQQRKFEREETTEENQLCFWEEYFPAAYYSLRDKEVPSFLHMPEPKYAFPMPKATAENLNPECPAFEALTDDQKREEYTKQLKTLAVLFARRANIENRLKDYSIEEKRYQGLKTYNEVQDVRNATLDEKHIAMIQFLTYATLYNQMVPEKDKLLFSISPDSKNHNNPVLDAHIPGFSRLSVHFGSEAQLQKSLRSVNRQLGEPVFEVNDIPKLYRDYQEYHLDDFDVTQTGVIVGNRSDEATALAQKMEEMKEDLACFSNFVCPHLNGRELFYLADMAKLGRGYFCGFGKGKHVGLKKIEKERRPLSVEERQEQYLETVLSDEQNQTPAKLKELYDLYLYSGELRGEYADLGLFMKMLSDKQIEGEFVSSFCTEQMKEELDQGMELDHLIDSDEPPMLKEETFGPVFSHLDNSTKMRLILNLARERKVGTLDNMVIEQPDVLLDNRERFLAMVEKYDAENGEVMTSMLRPILELQDDTILEDKENKAVRLSKEEQSGNLEDSFSFYSLMMEDAGESVTFESFQEFLTEEIGLPQASGSLPTSQQGVSITSASELPSEAYQVMKESAEQEMENNGTHRIAQVQNEEEKAKNEPLKPENGQPGES